jgi:hypothetical protein
MSSANGAGNHRVPDGWRDLNLIPPGHVLRSEDVDIKLGDFVQDLANAFGPLTSDRVKTNVLTALKPLLQACGTRWMPYSAEALSARLCNAANFKDKTYRADFCPHPDCGVWQKEAVEDRYDHDLTCECCSEICYVAIKKGGSVVRYLALDFDIMVDHYKQMVEFLERPAFMPCYLRTIEKLRDFKKTLDQEGPFASDDWLNETAREWFRMYGDQVDLDNDDVLWLFFHISADYMSTSRNFKATDGVQMFLGWVLQLLNLDHGVRQRSEWCFPDQMDAVRGKKPVSTQLRMEPRLEKARKFLQGEFVTYQCPHQNKCVAVQLHCVTLMIQGDGPMLEELMSSMGHACPRAFVEAELESVAGSQRRRLVPLSLNTGYVTGGDRQLLNAQQIDAAAASVDRGSATPQETGFHNSSIMVVGISHDNGKGWTRSCPGLSYATHYGFYQRGWWHIIKGVLTNWIECMMEGPTRMSAHYKQVLNARILNTLVARGEDPYARWAEYGFANMHATFSWFLHDCIPQLFGLIDPIDMLTTVFLWHYVRNIMAQPCSPVRLAVARLARECFQLMFELRYPWDRACKPNNQKILGSERSVAQHTTLPCGDDTTIDAILRVVLVSKRALAQNCGTMVTAQKKFWAEQQLKQARLVKGEITWGKGWVLPTPVSSNGDLQLNGVGRGTTVTEVLMGVKCAQLSLATELMKFGGMVAAAVAAMCAPSALATCYNGFRFLYQKPGLPPTSPIEAIVCCI